MTEHTHTRTATPAKPKTPGDLDWFDFETRMRKLIAELLEPTVLRTQDDKAQILLLRKMNETLKKRMDDAEFVQAKAAKRMDKLEEIWTRVKDLDNERLEDDAKMLEQMADFRKDLDSAKVHQEQLEQLIKNLDLRNDKLAHSVDASNQLMTESKEEVFLMLQRVKADLDTRMRAITEDLADLHIFRQETIAKLADHAEQLIDLADQCQVNRHNVLDVGNIANEAHEWVQSKTELAKHEAFVRLVNNNFKVLEEGLAKNALSANKENERKLNDTLKYIETKLPLEVNWTVAKTLDAVLAGRRDQLRLHSFTKGLFAESLGLPLKAASEPPEKPESEEGAAPVRLSLEAKSIISKKSQEDEDLMRSTISSQVRKKEQEEKQQQNSKKQQKKKKRKLTRKQYEESSGSSTQSEGEDEQEQQEEEDKQKEEEDEKEKEDEEWGGANRDSSNWEPEWARRGSEAGESESVADGILELLNKRYEGSKEQAKQLVERNTPVVIYKRLERLHERKQELRQMKKQIEKLSGMQAEVRDLRQKTNSLRAQGLASRGSQGGGFEDQANDSGGFGIASSGRFGASGGGKLGSGRASFLSKKTGGAGTNTSAFGTSKKVTPRIFKKSGATFKAASSEEPDHSEAEPTDRESEQPQQLSEALPSNRPQESITEENQEEAQVGAGLSLADTTVGQSQEEPGPATAVAAAKPSSRAPSSAKPESIPGSIHPPSVKESAAGGGSDAILVKPGSAGMRETGYLTVQGSVERAGSVESATSKRSVGSKQSAAHKQQQQQETLQAIREQSKLMTPETIGTVDMAGQVMNQFPMPGGEADAGSETLTLGQAPKTRGEVSQLLGSEEGAAWVHEGSQDTLLDTNLLNQVQRRGVVQVVKQEIEPEVWEAHSSQILELAEARANQVFEERFAAAFEGSFSALWEDRFTQDFQEHFAQKLETDVSEVVAERAAQLEEALQQRLGEIDEQFGAVGQHFEELQRKTKTKLEETQDYIQNIEIQVDNFIKKKHRSTNDQDALIKEIRDKVTAATERSFMAVSHLDTFAVLFSSILQHLSLQNSLDRQDHEDRRSIALMGYRTQSQNYHNQPLTTELHTGSDGQAVLRSSLPGAQASGAVVVNPGPNVVGIEKKCISCSGQLSFVMSSFKMACLSYAPSPVMYRGRVYPREDMHYVRNELLVMAQELLKKKLPVEEKGLTGKRYFDDAVLKLKNGPEESPPVRVEGVRLEGLNQSMRLSGLAELNQSVDETELSQTILPKINQSTATHQRVASSLSRRGGVGGHGGGAGGGMELVGRRGSSVLERRKGSSNNNNYQANLGELLPGLGLGRKSVFLK